MPVTFSPASHPLKAFEPEYLSWHSRKADGGISPRIILKDACYNQYRQSDEILQSSFDNLHEDSKTDDIHIIPQSNGFVNTVTEAYNNHRALVIRPDDVWLAILTQFSSFLNANAENIRSQFVRHKGQKELTITADRRKVDYGHVANQMTKEIEKNVVDPHLRAWILPDFSTTTANDTTVCSIVMMAAMKEYFSYKIHLLCGIPRVTLDGEKDDWEKIFARLEKLKEYGLPTIAWYHLLFPIIDRFVRSFDEPENEQNLDFWQKVAHYEGGGSGPSYLGGWITAFCVFDDKGKWLGHPFTENATESPNARSLSSTDFFSKYIDIAPVTLSEEEGGEEDEIEGDSQSEKNHLQLDGVYYHQIDTQDVPSGYSEVDVLLEDDDTEYRCMMVAGHVGTRILQSVDGGMKDTVKPVAGWWMLTKLPEGKFKDDRPETGVSVGEGEPRDSAMEATVAEQQEDKLEENQDMKESVAWCKCIVV
ncbi:hypothetical protein JR316_0003118 [Psilocybe cubensis]|uniref:Uncharacterized protein n=2 Tax=Psilocybe cubensis TaxID=181762 RepID=A0ACB8H6N2_PSICU|nr:hypothetical protein JR316_0003118 [Psilocybe cubensis]KAH9483648.1 hypothetical protein JR316_0003118 [Psilocybe cubensis]